MTFKYSTIPKNASHSGIYVKTIKLISLTLKKTDFIIITLYFLPYF